MKTENRSNRLFWFVASLFPTAKKLKVSTLHRTHIFSASQDPRVVQKSRHFIMICNTVHKRNRLHLYVNLLYLDFQSYNLFAATIGGQPSAVKVVDFQNVSKRTMSVTCHRHILPQNFASSSLGYGHGFMDEDTTHPSCMPKSKEGSGAWFSSSKQWITNSSTTPLTTPRLMLQDVSYSNTNLKMSKAAPWHSIAEMPYNITAKSIPLNPRAPGLKSNQPFPGEKQKPSKSWWKKMVVSEVSQHILLRAKLTTWVWYVHLGVRNHRSKDPFPFFNWLCHTSLSHGVFVFTSANPFPFGISCFGHFFPPPHWQRRHVDVLSRPSFRRRRAWVGHCRKVEGQKEITEKHESKKREAQKNG